MTINHQEDEKNHQEKHIKNHGPGLLSLNWPTVNIKKNICKYILCCDIGYELIWYDIYSLQIN